MTEMSSGVKEQRKPFWVQGVGKRESCGFGKNTCVKVQFTVVISLEWWLNDLKKKLKPIVTWFAYLSKQINNNTRLADDSKTSHHSGSLNITVKQEACLKVDGLCEDRSIPDRVIFIYWVHSCFLLTFLGFPEKTENPAILTVNFCASHRIWKLVSILVVFINFEWLLTNSATKWMKGSYLPNFLTQKNYKPLRDFARGKVTRAVKLCDKLFFSLAYTSVGTRHADD